jgi:hypothetical protein
MDQTSRYVSWRWGTSTFIGIAVDGRRGRCEACLNPRSLNKVGDGPSAAGAAEPDSIAHAAWHYDMPDPKVAYDNVLYPARVAPGVGGTNTPAPHRWMAARNFFAVFS